MSLSAFSSTSLPTPLFEARALATGRAELWIKDDGQSHSVYGGNKVRKLTALVAHARACGATRILTFGPAGSHHVLTTTLMGLANGLAVAAVLVPQPRSRDAEETLLAALAHGLDAHPAPNLAAVPLALRRAHRRGDYVIPPGASNARGTVAYARALEELLSQLEARGVPVPDVIVTPLGSGGTAAGLLAGVTANRLATTIHGVLVVSNLLAGPMTRRLARGALESLGVRRKLRAKSLEILSGYVGPGYARPTEDSVRATALAARVGLTLDATYTAKAFAHALALLTRPPEHLPRARVARVLYWHTYSTTPARSLLTGNAAERLPRSLDALLL